MSILYRDGVAYVADKWLAAVVDGRLADAWPSTTPALRRLMVAHWADSAEVVLAPVAVADLCADPPRGPYVEALATVTQLTVGAAVALVSAPNDPELTVDPVVLSPDARLVYLQDGGVRVHATGMPIALTRAGDAWMVAGVGGCGGAGPCRVLSTNRSVSRQFPASISNATSTR